MQLPPLKMDWLDVTHPDWFVSGCVAVTCKSKNKTIKLTTPEVKAIQISESCL